MKMRFILIPVVMLMLFQVSCVDNNETPPPAEEFTYGEIVTVQQVKALYADELVKDYTERFPVLIESDWALRGIITASDMKDGNLYKEAYIEDGSGGLRLLFDASSGLYIGDSVIVKVKDLYIGDYGDFWQVGGDPYFEEDGDVRVSGMNMDDQVLKLSINNPTYPATVTLIQAKSSGYLGRLVKLDNVQFTAGMNGLTWADKVNFVTENRDLEDCQGNDIIVRTSGYSSMAGELLPTGKGSLTGIVTVFGDTYQLIIRDFSEVNMTGARCGLEMADPVETLSQNFTGLTADRNIALTGWHNIPQAGTRYWQAKTYSGNTYAQATAYNSNQASVISWLITPPVTISAQKVLTFQSAQAYWAHGTAKPLDVLFSADYDGTNLLTATWVPLTATLATSTNANYAFVSSGNVNLPVEAGEAGVIAFRYTGSQTLSTSFCIDNISVTAAK